MVGGDDEVGTCVCVCVCEGGRWVIEEVRQRSMFDTALILLLSVK